MPNAYTVNALGDAGAGAGLFGDLRYCVTQADANAGSTISVQVVGAIQLTKALPSINGNVVSIVGTGKSQIQGSGNANNLFSVFTVLKGASVNFDNLTIQGGYATAGGGVYNSGTLSLLGVTINNNKAQGSGGGIYNKTSGVLWLTDDTITGNTVTAGSGGGICNLGTVQTCNEGEFGTLIKANAAPNGSGGGLDNLGTANFSGGEDTFSDNQANLTSGQGGGVYNFSTGTFTLSAGTIAANEAYQGGGLFNEGTATLDGAEVSYNTALQGGGMYLNSASTTTFTKVTVQNNQLLPGGKGKGVAFQMGATMNNLAGLNDIDDGGAPVPV